MIKKLFSLLIGLLGALLIALFGDYLLGYIIKADTYTKKINQLGIHTFLKETFGGHGILKERLEDVGYTFDKNKILNSKLSIKNQLSLLNKKPKDKLPKKIKFSNGKEYFLRSFKTSWDPKVSWGGYVDQYHRRYTVNKSSSSKNIIAFMGCSFIYGAGLVDKETLPSQIGKKYDHVYSYNYGMNAFGIHHHLYSMENFQERYHDLKNKTGDVVYGIWEDQLLRTSGKLSACCPPQGPAYKLRGEGLEFEGFWETNSIVNIMKNALFFSNIRRIMRIQLRDTIEEDDILVSCNVLKKIKRNVNKLNSKLNFSVFFYASQLNEPLSKLARCLKHNDVRVLNIFKDFSKINNLGVKVKLPDGHPNEEYNKYLSDIIANELSLKRVKKNLN